MPAPIVPILGIILSLLARKKIVSFEEASLLQDLIESIGILFTKAKRRCTSANYECQFKDGSCFILLTKGKNWKIPDIQQCPYRKKLEGK